jgi:hypothetical protein
MFTYVIYKVWEKIVRRNVMQKLKNYELTVIKKIRSSKNPKQMAQAFIAQIHQMECSENAKISFLPLEMQHEEHQ